METYNGHYIIIKKKNGMYFFPSKKDEIAKTYIDLSKCNCLDDLIMCISDFDVKELEIKCGKGTIVLVKDLSEELLSNDNQLKIIWNVEEISTPCICVLEKGKVLVASGTEIIQSDNICSFSEVMEILHDDHQIIDESYSEIIKDAFCLMMTGKYPNSYNFTKAKHVYVPKKTILDEIDLYRYMDINSVIFLPISEYDEKTHYNWKNRYYNNIHYIDKEKIYLDMRGTEIKWTMNEYSEFMKQNESFAVNDISCFLDLKSEKDLERLLEDLEYFSNTGKVRNHNFYLVNECRWANRCSFLYQMRFSLHEDLSLSVCGDASRVDYSIFDDEYDQFTCREIMIERSQIINKCKKCSVNSYCTKCIYHLENFKDSVFCKIMNEHLEIQDYINIKNALIILERFGKMNNKFKVNEMSFANYSYTLLLPRKMKGKKPISFNAYLFEYNGRYYCFNPVKGKIFQIGIYMAFILEAIQKGYDYDETEYAFNEKWKDIFEKKNFSVAWDKVNNIIIH